MNMIKEERLLRWPEVHRKYPVSKGHWYEGIKDGRYPAGIRLSKRIVVWRESEIDALVQRALSGELEVAQ